MNRILACLGMTAIALMMSSCAGIGFDSAWNQAVEDYESGKNTDAVSGPWTGTWLSHENAHTGDLRCLVTRESESENLHHFRYHATWGQSLRGGFKAKFPVQADGKGYLIKGSQSLGLFGKFNHDGRIEGESFNAEFGSAKGDYGVFEMTRPGGD